MPENEYIAALKEAKASENEAIRIYTILLAYAPKEDAAEIAEILSDENNHDIKLTDLIFKALTGESGDQAETVGNVDETPDVTEEPDAEDGSETSGFYKHKGRPGFVGGSVKRGS